MPHIEPYSDSEIDMATDAALEMVLWSEGDITDAEGDAVGPTWDSRYDAEDFTDAQRAKMREKIAAFMTANLTDLVATGHTATLGDDSGIKRIGFDYVLTTAGHGAGFWDRGYGEAGDRLSEVCRAERAEWNLYEASEHVNGEPGKVYSHELEG